MSRIITATHLGAVNGQGSVGPMQVGNSPWVSVCVCVCVCVYVCVCVSRSWFLVEGNTVTQKNLNNVGGSDTFSSQ